MARRSLLFCVGMLLLPIEDATAQTKPAPQIRCEPTLNNPCKPPALGSTTGPIQRREPLRLDQSPIPDVQFDRNTSFGIGHGGIIGLERKFEPQ